MRLPKRMKGDFLASRAWYRLRARHLKRHPDCAWCPAKGPKGMTVDHIEPRYRRPDLALEPSNLQTLCGPCHGRAKQHHERTAGDVLEGGASSTGWPKDPGHPWNLAAGAAPAARLAPKRGLAGLGHPPGRQSAVAPKKRP